MKQSACALIHVSVLILWLSSGCLAFSSSTLSARPTFLPVPATGSGSESIESLPLPTKRAIEISHVVFGQFLKPVVSALLTEGIPDNWNSFWSQTQTTGLSHSQNGTSALTNAQRLASAVEQLGPTYVKFAQAVSSRPDIVPKSLCDALSVLQDDMEPFDSETAKRIIRSELSAKSSVIFPRDDPEKLEIFLQSLSSEPVAAASVGQVFSGFLPRYGKVAIKVQRPGIREVVERDAHLLRSVATWIESVPAIPLPGIKSQSTLEDTAGNNKRLIATELVSSVDEFMSRLFEELDYHNEANNMEKFASLYSIRRWTSKESTKVVVPEVLLDLCTDNVIVMEWIEGTKLTNVVNEDGSTDNESLVAENLALVELCIDCTLSQLLDTGVLHADPHGKRVNMLLLVVLCLVHTPDLHAFFLHHRRKPLKSKNAHHPRIRSVYAERNE